MIKAKKQIKTIKNFQFNNLEKIINKEDKAQDFVIKKTDAGFDLICFELIELEKKAKK